MIMTPLESRFLTILSQHVGLARAISVADMAEALGLGREKAGQREAQRIKRGLVELGYAIGSSCGKHSGWYIPTSDQEMQSTLKQYSSRFYSLSVLIKRTKAMIGRVENPQLSMRFEQEEIHA